MRTVTLFTWGYWGWGRRTRELVDAVDAVERSRGFKPPLFVDIRYHRNVRAEGFRGASFGNLIGSRYRWMQPLGNRAVRLRSGPRVRIANPAAADDLLDQALAGARRKQRVIFFCSCQYPGLEGHGGCHRGTVARLVLEAARRRGTTIEIVEWPGGLTTKIGRMGYCDGVLDCDSFDLVERDLV